LAFLLHNFVAKVQYGLRQRKVSTPATGLPPGTTNLNPPIHLVMPRKIGRCQMPCPLCKAPDASDANKSTRIYDIHCSACGHYYLTFEASAAIGGDEKLAFCLASWVSEQTVNGVTPTVRNETVGWIKSYPRPTVKKRAELYLGAAIKILGGKLIGRVGIADQRLRVASWSYDSDDCLALAKYLKKLGALEDPGNMQEMRVVAEGHLIHEEMTGQRAQSSQVFVAMWFDDVVKEAYDGGIGPAIREAGYEPLRVDRKEHDGKIDDQIIAEIRRSAFLVADFTEHRGGVYYEAGFAHGLGRRVLFTCREDHIDKLHFDVRQYNTILWKNPGEIVIPLQRRILALFGAGPLKPDARPL
jgi:hypothetical protein